MQLRLPDWARAPRSETPNPKFFAAPALLALAALCGDVDWPGWRGPGGSGVARGAPPLVWSESENVRWKVPVPGRGNSSPVVSGERVYVTTAIPTSASSGGAGPAVDPRRGEPASEQDFAVLAFERDTGALAWRTTVRRGLPAKGLHPNGSFASPTPAVDGERVVASFGSMGLFALALDGTPLWELDLGPLELAECTGEGSSPVLFGDTLVLSNDHHGDSFVVAVDARSGCELWRRPRDTGPGWSSPLVFEARGRPLVVVGAERTVAYDLATGEELWSSGEPAARGSAGTIASPVRAASTSRAAGLVIAVAGSELVALDAASGEARWRHRGGPQAPSPLAHDGRVFALKSNAGILTTLDLESGTILHGPLRLEGAAQVFASPILAAGHLYVPARDGTTTVLALAPATEVVARNGLDDRFVASPAASRDELFLRGFASLYCIASD